MNASKKPKNVMFFGFFIVGDFSSVGLLCAIRLVVKVYQKKSNLTALNRFDVRLNESCLYSICSAQF